MSADNRFSLEEILEAERRAKMGAEDGAETESVPIPAGKPRISTETEELPDLKLEAEPVPVETVEEHYTEAEREEEPKRGRKEKKEKRGFFARWKEKKQKDDFDAAEDMYYGIQLKPIDEYTRGFDATGEISLQAEGFKKLFDENTAELDDEVAKNFDRLQKERRRRVAEAVENAGVDIDEVENELGIVAPVPVSAFAGDPYAKQHGIDIEKDADGDNLPGFQKAMLQDAQTRTMEIKLDLENETFGVQQAKVVPEVSEDSVRRILETVQDKPAAQEPAAEEPVEVPSVHIVPQKPKTAPVREFTDVSSFSEEEKPETEVKEPEAPKAEPEQPEEETKTEAPAPEETPARISTPVTDVTQYRKRDLPVHIINADVLQSALLSEARIYSEDSNTSAPPEDPLRRRPGARGSARNDGGAGE